MPPLGSAELRAIGEGHSNSSVVVGEQIVLKVYRRLAAGNNPELELLRFLTEHGFANSPRLLGSYEHRAVRSMRPSASSPASCRPSATAGHSPCPRWRAIPLVSSTASGGSAR